MKIVPDHSPAVRTYSDQDFTNLEMGLDHLHDVRDGYRPAWEDHYRPRPDEEAWLIGFHVGRSGDDGHPCREWGWDALVSFYLGRLHGQKARGSLPPEVEDSLDFEVGPDAWPDDHDPDEDFFHECERIEGRGVVALRLRGGYE